MESINLKEVEQLIKTATEFKDKEKEKFKVGLIIKESIDALRSTLSSLEQLEARGDKINSARKDNLKTLRLILLNILDLSLILGVGSRPGVELLISQLEAKISPTKKEKKTPIKVSD